MLRSQLPGLHVSIPRRRHSSVTLEARVARIGVRIFTKVHLSLEGNTEIEDDDPPCLLAPFLISFSACSSTLPTVKVSETSPWKPPWNT